MRLRPARLITATAFCALLLAPVQALASTLVVSVPNTEATISEQRVNGESYLFLPSQVQQTSLSLACVDDEGNPVEATARLTPEVAPAPLTADPLDVSSASRTSSDELGDTLTITIKAADEEDPRQVNLKFSASIRSLFIRSTKGRAYIEEDPLHNTKDTGQLTVLAPDGTPIYDGELKQVKGRGNTTWSYSPKKPYQIKLATKADLVACGDASKTWVLLASAADPTLLRNTVALNLARGLGIGTASGNAPADVYYDGEYLGSYLICEKVEVGSGRIDIVDLEDLNDEANADNPAWAEPTLQNALNTFGKRFTYVEGATDPDDVTGGYLFEYDYHPNLDDITFTTTFGDFTLKSPEPPTYGEAKRISETAETAFLRLLAGEESDLQGSVADYFDVDDLTRIGWFEEYVGEGDYFYISSTYFALNQGNALIKAVAPWDFDRSFWLNDVTSFHGFLASALLGNPSLQKRCATLQQNELEPLVSNVLLGGADAVSDNGQLRSLVSYEQELRASRQMDETLWGLGPMRDEWIVWDPEIDTTYQANFEKLHEFLVRRLAWCNDWVEKGSAGTWAPEDGWYNRGNVKSYIKDGQVVRGWVEDDSGRVFIDPTYGVTYRSWRKIDDEWFLVLADGTLASGWEMDGDFWYYLDPKTNVMQKGWVELDGLWYWFDITDGWMHRGWVLDRGNWYYLDPATCHMLRGGWLAYDGYWYYLKNDGSMATQWRQYNGQWFWLGYDGVLKHGWQEIAGERYYFDLFTGAMLTGWQELDGQRYYFDPATGAMVRGMVMIAGEWNWFDANGVYLY